MSSNVDFDPNPPSLKMGSGIVRVLRIDMAPAASASVTVGGGSLPFLPRLCKIVFFKMQRGLGGRGGA